MAELYAVCTNVGKCRKTGDADIVSIDPTIGGVVICSDCGRRLTNVAKSREELLSGDTAFPGAEIPRAAPSPSQPPPQPLQLLGEPPRRLSRPQAFIAVAAIAVLAVVPQFFADHDQAAAAVETIRVCGASTAASQLAYDVARGFFRLHGGSHIHAPRANSDNETTISTVITGAATPAEIQIAGHGSSRGFAALAENRCDLIISMRKIHDDEASKLDGLRGYIIGQDALVIAVNPSNRVDRLTEDQIRGIFSGEITRWYEVGGADRKIDVIAPDDASEYDALRTALLNDQDPAAAEMLPMSAISAAVASDPDAIAIDSFAHLAHARAIRILGRLNTLIPTARSILAGAYPFTTRVYIYTAHGAAQPVLLPQFVAYLRSAAAGGIVNNDGLMAAN